LPVQRVNRVALDHGEVARRRILGRLPRKSAEQGDGDACPTTIVALLYAPDRQASAVSSNCRTPAAASGRAKIADAQSDWTEAAVDRVPGHGQHRQQQESGGDDAEGEREAPTEQQDPRSIAECSSDLSPATRRAPGVERRGHGEGAVATARVATVVAHSRAVACASIQTSTRHAAAGTSGRPHDEGCPAGAHVLPRQLDGARAAHQVGRQQGHVRQEHSTPKVRPPRRSTPRSRGRRWRPPVCETGDGCAPAGPAAARRARRRRGCAACPACRRSGTRASKWYRREHQRASPRAEHARGGFGEWRFREACQLGSERRVRDSCTAR